MFTRSARVQRQQKQVGSLEEERSCLLPSPQTLHHCLPPTQHRIPITIPFNRASHIRSKCATYLRRPRFIALLILVGLHDLFILLGLLLCDRHRAPGRDGRGLVLLQDRLAGHGLRRRRCRGHRCNRTIGRRGCDRGRGSRMVRCPLSPLSSLLCTPNVVGNTAVLDASRGVPVPRDITRRLCHTYADFVGMGTI
jgi:hypothetical protein